VKKTDFSDGICNTCGNVGLAGDHCIVCGDLMSKIDEGLVDPVVNGEEEDEDFSGKEPDVYPLEALEEDSSGDSDDLE